MTTARRVVVGDDDHVQAAEELRQALGPLPRSARVTGRDEPCGFQLVRILLALDHIDRASTFEVEDVAEVIGDLSNPLDAPRPLLAAGRVRAALAEGLGIVVADDLEQQFAVLIDIVVAGDHTHRGRGLLQNRPRVLDMDAKGIAQVIDRCAVGAARLACDEV